MIVSLTWRLLERVIPSLRFFCAVVPFAGVVAHAGYAGASEVVDPVTPVVVTQHGQITLATGFRVDNLDWSIADSDGSPNVLSELTWRDMRSPFVSINAQWERSRVRLRMQGTFANIQSGDNIDSDYNGDDRTQEFSRSENDAGGDAAGASAAIGYRFQFDDPSIRRPYFLTPWLGYGAQWQWLKITNGFQTIPASGSFTGLDSSYDAQWDGYTVGLGFDGAPRQDTNVHLEVMYYPSLNYYAEANWNLQSQFEHPLSFSHTAEGEGVHFTASVSHQWTDKIAVYLDFQRHVFRTEKGLDRAYLVATGPDDTTLNEANWDSSRFSIGLIFRLW